MRRLLMASALLALTILATAATGQPPAGDKKGPADKAEKKALDPTETAIAAAMANDADVRMAKAKIQLAEAELAKARQAATLRVVMLKARIEQLKTDVRSAENGVARLLKLAERGMISQEEVITARDKLEAAKAALGVADAEWKLLTGPATTSGTADSGHDRTVASALQHIGMSVASDARTAELLARYVASADLMQARTAVKGPIPDRIRAALDKPVKLAEKGQYVQFQAACEAFKKAGLDIPIRQKQKGDIATLTSDGEELPIGAWLQFFLDETPGTVMVVREYGILVTDKAGAPPDAPTVLEFWKQKAPPAKDAKPETPK